jgi:putative transcriptional regulator
VAAGLLVWVAVADVASVAPLNRDPARLKPGVFLYATPRMGDGRFRETVILILEHGDEGSIGVVVNQPSDTALRKAMPSVPEAIRSELPVYWGGPVQPQDFLVLLRDPGTGLRAKRVLAGVFLTANLEDLRSALAEPRPDRGVRVYAGYAGWSRGQLAMEIRRGQWVLDDADAASVFAADPTLLWEKVHAILAQSEARVRPAGRVRLAAD